MRAAGAVPRIVLEIGSREAVREAVASGMRFGVVAKAEHVDDKRVICLPFADATFYNLTHIVCLRDRRGSRLVDAFIAATRLK